MFNQNKAKLDSKVRFQNQSFKNRLQAQRNYKRNTRQPSQSRTEILLGKIGLGSLWAKISLAVFFAILIYLIYIPNVFFVKTVWIDGANPAVRDSIKTITWSYLNKNFPTPRKNLFFLSTSALADYLEKNSQSILKVEKITKSISQRIITITIKPRIDAFKLQTPNGEFIAATDGLITQTLEASTTVPNDLINVKLQTKDPVFSGQQAFSQTFADFITQCVQKIPAITSAPVASFELSAAPETDLTVYVSGNYQILLDTATDLNQSLGRLKMIFSQLLPADIASLQYVDLRFKDRGYVCHKGQPCVKEISLPNNAATATTTIDDLNINSNQP